MIVKTVYVDGKKINITNDVKPGGTYYRARITTHYDPVTKIQKQKTISGNSIESVVDQIYLMMNPRLAAPRYQNLHISMGEAVSDYIEQHYANGNPRTYQSRKSKLNTLIQPVIGSRQFVSFSHKDAQEYVDLISNYYAPQTVRSVVSTISRCYETYISRGEIPFNPFTDVRLPIDSKPKGTVLTEEELLRLFAALQKTPYSLFFSCCALMALRIGECRGLAWGKIDENTKLITIDQQIPITSHCVVHELKNKNPSTLYYTDEVFDILHRQKAIQDGWKREAGDKWDNPDNLVFTDKYGHFIPSDELYKAFNKAKEEAAIPSSFRVHDFRHTMASFLWEDTHNIDKVRIILRHKTIATTRHYIHTTQKTKLECKELMDRVSSRLMHPTTENKAE